ncbi:HEAT repeat domain-containing protein [Streptomyces sp. NPDC031705]|uniref:HEAT repeat domain-containing protein n=1 Tax=Streptomyces sp. NPDC031705 TaxID=3155729 RepID=UPI0033C475BC
MQLLDDPSPQVRISALSSLGFLQPPSTLRKICSLANDDSPRVRSWVAIALGNFSSLELAELEASAVLDQLAADADPYVRDEAAAGRRRKPSSSPPVESVRGEADLGGSWPQRVHRPSSSYTGRGSARGSGVHSSPHSGRTSG